MNRSFTLPYAESLEALRTTGQQYPDELQNVTPLGHDLTHLNRRGVPKQTAIDDMALGATEHVYATDPEVRAALAEHGVRPYGPLEAASFIGRTLMGDELVVALSGYASGGGFTYAPEADGIETVFDHLDSRDMTPGLVVDGGTRLGVPGLSALIAGHRGITTLGITPKQGFDELAPHDHFIAHGDQYGDETSLIGSIPDLLVVIGGGPNSSKEYRTALRNGAKVLMLALREYPPDSLANTYGEIVESEEALRVGQLAVCRSVDDIPSMIDRLLPDRDSYLAQRAQRASRALGILLPQS